MSLSLTKHRIHQHAKLPISHVPGKLRQVPDYGAVVPLMLCFILLIKLLPCLITIRHDIAVY